MDREFEACLGYMERHCLKADSQSVSPLGHHHLPAGPLHTGPSFCVPSPFSSSPWSFIVGAPKGQ
jgi:hypothetical protein